MSRANRKGAGPRIRDERGAAAVEFAIVSVVFIVMIFGMLTYGFVFALQHNMNHAAAEGARDALKATLGTEETRAHDTAVGALSFKQAHDYSTVEAHIISGAGCVPSDTTIRCMHVTITFSYKDHPLVPPLFSIGVPDTMTADYTVQLDG